ncbi:MAG: AmmeMemoRadiSam system protein A [Ignavibacteriae bacterium]|nr:AmmeMemoRadiSam system protein A [Ignavibacteriota bacterium]MCB9207188.1 AmmeMemoRadiSam system protein A [Ignavibacteriales bacterium]MCB9210325.1 AmmeMemoRadiSam system protein A [Ignavibacteriales bacterium]MCB9219130.1 AmmeMemoRadiSam system protein A [Ignavibacteriales bacterium]MCB9259712.1 AmmeMemoRadiSam system protein A [Ignavibacteriales bacterium]
MVLTNQEKKQILLLARHSIEKEFNKNSKLDMSIFNSDIFAKKLGVFVTLTINRKLRGCIGYVFSDEELRITVGNAAFQAAFHDPRFSPLTLDEYKNINLEVSILSEPFPLNSYDEIVIGKHGLLLEDMGRRALLLPQVPIEHNLDKDSFLSSLCTKAGLYENYWKEKQLKLKGFTATVFSENDLELE